MTISEGTLATGPEGGGAGLPLLSLEGISKQYPGVKALTNVDLELRAGRGHALVGENGAGKSTLIKIISGIVQPDGGRVLLDGQHVRFRSPAEARRRGVSLVPQELSLVPNVSVAENIFMGQLVHRGPLVSRGELNRATQGLLERLGLEVDPSSPLGEHPPAVQQMVMIARGIALSGRLFILDEPTAALTDAETERLFAVLKELKADGAALLYVSHRLEELHEIVDDITVLRDGQVVDRFLAKEVSEDDLVRSMVGRSIERFFDTRSRQQADRRVLLSVKGLTRRGSFEDVSFSLHGGEVVGLAGLVGAGRTEVAQAIFGIDRYERGDIEVNGKSVRIKSPRDAIAAGLALVPEERKAQGLILDRSISDNTVLPHLRELATALFFSERRLRSYSRRIAEDAGVRAPSVTVPVRSLSGGNQQKVVLGRWLTEKPKVYILDEPTRGIDIGAKAEIYQQIGRLADEGAAVLVISSELPELLGICDRILVMRAGRLVGELGAATATEESVLELAMGTRIEQAAIEQYLLPPEDAKQFSPIPGSVVKGPISGGTLSLPYSSSLPLPEGPIGDPNKTYTFCFSQALTRSSWATAQKESVMLEAAKHPNVEVLYHNTNNDPLRQVEGLETCVARSVDAILIWPHSVGPLTRVVERAKKAGSLVVGMERTVATRNYDTWIFLDFPKATGDLAEAVGKELNGKGIVAETSGTVGSSPQILRHEGFAKALKAKCPDIEVATTAPTDYSRAEGYKVALDFLQSGKKIDAWYVHYSDIALGVWEAMQELGRTDIPIYTIGDDKQAVKDVQDGKFRVLAPWTPLHGDLALRAAAYHIMGREVPKDIVLSQPPLITKENAAQELERAWGGSVLE